MTDPKHLTLATVRKRLSEIESRRIRYCGELDNERAAVIARCPHDWKFSPDPSGNNDSHYWCPACDKTVRRLP